MQVSNLPSAYWRRSPPSYTPKNAKTDYPHGLSALGSDFWICIYGKLL